MTIAASVTLTQDEPRQSVSTMNPPLLQVYEPLPGEDGSWRPSVGNGPVICTWNQHTLRAELWLASQEVPVALVRIA